MNSVFEDRQHVIQRIQDRVIEIQRNERDVENENNEIKQFVKLYPYPSYNEVRKLINGNVAMCAEYGTLNHSWMEKMYNNILNSAKVKVIGKLINTRGGNRAMDENFSVFMIVVRYLLNQVGNKSGFDLNAIQYNIYSEVNTAWHNIGSWRA